MSRQLRTFSHTGVYHIIIKGIDNQDIFYDDNDRVFFKKQLKEIKHIFKIQFYAYCLMSNHVHLVLRISNDFLSKGMQSLSIRYAHYFNKKYNRVGPFLQKRFNSKSIENERYLIAVCRYVHRNPEKAGFSKTEDYKWSSYNEYINKPDLIDTGILLHYLNNNIDEFINYTITTIYNQFSDFNEIDNFKDYEIVEKLTDQEVCELIMQKFNLNFSFQIPLLLKNKNENEFKNYIEEINKIKGTNKTQISRILRIAKRRIEKYWK